MKRLFVLAMTWLLTSPAFATMHDGVEAYLDFDPNYVVPREKVDESY